MQNFPHLLPLHPSISSQIPTQEKKKKSRFTLAVYFALRISSLLSIDVPKAVTPFGTLSSAIIDEAQHSLTKSGVDEVAVLIKTGRRS